MAAGILIKKCSNCGKEKAVHPEDPKQSGFYIAARYSDGTVKRWQSWCKICVRRENRKRAGISRRGKPYRARTKKTRAQRLEERRRRYRQQMQDPEARQRKRAHARATAERQRRAKGIPERGMRYRRWKADTQIIFVNRYESHADEVPLGPFRAWLISRLRVYGSIDVLAFRTGLNKRRLNTYINLNPNRSSEKWSKTDAVFRVYVSHPKFVRIETVDKALQQEGTTMLWELYPLLY